MRLDIYEDTKIAFPWGGRRFVSALHRGNDVFCNSVCVTATEVAHTKNPDIIKHAIAKLLGMNTDIVYCTLRRENEERCKNS